MVSDPIFDSFTSLDWQYYYAHMLEDEEEEFNRTRSYIEYLASFSNHKAVQAVRNARDEEKMVKELGLRPHNTNNIVSTKDDKEFMKFIEKKFGSRAG